MSTERTLRRMKRVLTLLAPPVALMGLIFFLSAQPDLSSGLGTADLILRKAAHMLEYGVLLVLWNRALSGAWRTWSPVTLLSAAVIAVGYAIGDEIHQSFVKGRHGAPMDVGIDAIGAAVGAVAVVVRGTRRIPKPPDAAMN